ncbi:MAG: superoxide dismutase [Ni] [Pseudomonadota bacterium]
MLRYATFLYVVFAVGSPIDVYAHCQVPCGIYDDVARVKQMREDVVTISKAVDQINNLAQKKSAQDQNQFVRWVMTKEQHAERIIRTISDYFLAQKIKPVASKEKKEYAQYLDMLARHHAVMVAAMKCKQGSGEKEVKNLGEAISEIEGFWIVSTGR